MRLLEFSEQLEVAFPTEVTVPEVKCHQKIESQSSTADLGFENKVVDRTYSHQGNWSPTQSSGQFIKFS